MSHTTTVTTQIKSEPALRVACERVGATLMADTKEVQLFSGSRIKCDAAVQLKGWHYPVSINYRTGEVKYDNYNGSWGKQEEFDQLNQQYSLAVVEQEPSVQELIGQGWTLEPAEKLPNGDLKVRIVEPQF